MLTQAIAQPETSINATDKYLKEQVLQDIQENLNQKTLALDSTITQLDEKVNYLDNSIKATKNASVKVDKLLERVKALEEIQATIEQNELNVYQANYQSAMINLVSMEREIKPLILFNSTKNFFGALSETANPTSYPGYKKWYKKFYGFVQKEKDKDARLSVLNNLLSLTGNLANGTPLSGPITESFFSGISIFINSLGRSEKELRAESEKMFLLTVKISQFTHDKDMIEDEWASITTELEALQKYYDEILQRNFELLGLSKSEFEYNFSRESDAKKRYDYLTSLKQKVAEEVAKQKQDNPNEWKEKIYYQLMDVQALKLRFGNITFKISENISRYTELIAKYKNDQQIGSKVATLESKLVDLKNTFDRAFDPAEYINSATRMYKVD
ncbi:MAG: hypothetical protein DWQ02_28575 [Bacteroidetes bacterium]|nr:MAG: hypothetical protein DWQ02_28575 [Bacteroidota bacterium]